MNNQYQEFDTPDPELLEYKQERMAEILDFAEKQLIERGATVFQSGGRLVHPVRLEKLDTGEDDGIRRPAGALLVRTIASYRLKEYLTTHVAFFVTTMSGFKRIAAPLAVVSHLQAREDMWRFPVLNGIIETPTLRADGSLLQDEGYDFASGLWADFNGVEFPEVKSRPSRNDALTALKMLKELLAGFPFVTTSNGESPSRSAALSAILTAVVRRSLHSAPLHASSAPTPGTGKTLLWDSVGQIATGRPIAAVSQGRTQEEDEKRFFAVLLEGAPLVLIDNVAHPIGGEAICTVLTESTYRGRILGESRTAEVKTNALWLATGNNLTFEGDITRRVIMAKMDAGMEHPETRAFDIDLKAYIPKYRPRLVAAALTILRAHLAAGLPGASNLEKFGSFDQWSDWVRGALVWLGEADPCLTRKFIEGDDPEREAAAALLAAIYGEWGEKWFKVGELLDDDVEETLSKAVMLATPPGRDHRKLLGHYLQRQKGRIYGGLMLQDADNTHAKTKTYRVRRAPGATTEFG